MLKVEVSFGVEMDGTITGVRVLNITDVKTNNHKYDKLSEAKKAKAMDIATKNFRNEAVRLVKTHAQMDTCSKGRTPCERPTGYNY